MSTITRSSELLLRWQELRQQGQCLSAEELCADCPELAEELRNQIRALESMEALLGLQPDQRAEASTAPASPRTPDGNGVGTDRFRIPGYEILRVLEQGGMGIVYLARQQRLNRLVAVKMILAGSRAGPLQLARFRTEAEAVARLQHPNIVQIYEVGDWRAEDGSPPMPYFSMEFVEGGSLAERLSEAPLPAREAALLIQTLARAVQVAHQAGIVHRDLKPGNILLQGLGTRDQGLGIRDQGLGSAAPDSLIPNPQSLIPKITDFGLAKRLEDELGAATPGGQTQTGAIVGTPSYMAPEQAEGRTREIGPAVDIHALGAILYEMLTGRPPFRGETTLDTLEQVRSQEPVPLRRLQPKLPRDLETICLKCLQKEPHQRYPTAQDLADDLQHFLAGEPIRARPTSAMEQGIKWAKRQPALAALILACAVALAALLASGIWFTARLRTERDNARQAQQQAEEKQLEVQRERDEAERQRKRAEGLLHRCLAVVDDNAWSMVRNKGEIRRDSAPGSILYNLARVYALAATSSRDDADLALADRRQLAEQYAARAVELLVHAQAAGYFTTAGKLDKLKSDRDLDGLRSREDFQDLLAKLEKPSPPSPEP